MRFKQYISEGRSKDISEKKAFELIDKNCQRAYDAYMDDRVMYRGVKGAGQYAYIDPKSGKPRKSANTENYYTILIDGSPLWKKYPKRSQSVICTTSYKKAMPYGRVYTVFPYDGSTIGIAPKSDFWFSFYRTLGDMRSLDAFNHALFSLFNNDSVKINIDNFSSITQFKSSIDFLSNTLKDEEEAYGIDTRNIILRKWKWKKEGLYDHIKKLLSPDKNMFEWVNDNRDLPTKSADGQELWTDGKCIMLSDDMGDKNESLIRYMDTGKIGYTDDEYTDFLVK